MSKWFSARNLLAAAAAPFTAGLSTLAMENGDGDSIIGDITGENSAKKANKKNIELQKETNQTSINLANTAHQREVKDLKMAGLNPVLSAGGSGATTPTLGTAQVQNTMPGGYLAQAQSAAQIANLAGTAKQAIASAEATPQIAESEVFKNNAEAWSTLKRTEPDIEKTLTERQQILQQIAESKSREELNKAEKGLREWESKHPVAAKLLGGAPAAASSIAGSAVMAHALKAGQAARETSARSVKVNAGQILTGGTNPNAFPGGITSY